VSRRPRALLLLALLAALMLAGPSACGKRGRLEPPEGTPTTWPRPYPAT
jgi:predicted small lipoprotein YifL